MRGIYSHGRLRTSATAYAPRLWLLVSLLALTLGPALPETMPAVQAQATVLVTNSSDSGPGSLRQAIADASSGDTITFAPEIARVTLTSDYLIIGKNLTIDGGDVGIIIERDANASTEFRIFEITGAATEATLASLTIRGGIAPAGGGILNNGGTLTVQHSTISGNTANGTASESGGGGIFNNNGTLTVQHSTIRDNEASGTDITSGLGGGILSFNTLTVQYSTISDNTAQFGGGIINGGTATLEHSTISGNKASGDGGGINHIGTLNMTNSTISGNTADEGGGVRNVGILNIIHSTINDNTASIDGGGIDNGGVTTLANSIVANSTNGDIENTGTITVTRSSIIETFSGGFGNLIVLGSAANLIMADPQLGPLADNGGPTLTHAPQSGSPAIDAGANSIVTDNDLTTDQRGFARQIDAPNDLPGLDVDIGAVEVQPTCFAQALDASGAVFAEAFPSIDATALRGVLNQGAAATVRVAGFCGGTDSSQNGGGMDNVASIGTTITIQGGYPVDFAASTADFSATPDPDAHETVLSGQGSGRVLHIGDRGNVTLDGLTIRSSSATNTQPGNRGGGIFNEGTLSVQHSSIRNNTAISRGGGITNEGTLSVQHSTIHGNTSNNRGGGITNEGTLTLQDSTLSGNTALDEGGGLDERGETLALTGNTISGNIANIGGGIYTSNPLTIAGNIISGNRANNGGGIYTGDTLSVQHSTLNGNVADNGGGIFNSRAATVETSDLSGNRASTDGGGISNDGTMTVARSTLRDNVAADDGGGIYDSGPLLTVQNSTLSGNVADDDGGGIYNQSVIEALNSASDSRITTDVGNTVNVIHSIISGNSASDGGGIFNNDGGTVLLANTIVANNTANDVEQFLFALLIAAGTNIIETAVSGGDIAGAIENISNTDPQLGPLADNGGPTLTHLPLAGSPVINAGDSDIANGTAPPADLNGDGVVDSSDTLDIDQRGLARICGGNVDLGAVEVQCTTYGIALAPRSLSEGDSGTIDATVTITRSGATSVAGSVDVALSGTATENDDYTIALASSGASFAGGTLSFDTDVLTASLTLAVQGDNSDEDDETISLTLSNPTPAGTSGIDGTNPVTLTIVDDDTAGISISTSSLSIAEGDQATYTIALTSEPNAPVTVSVTSGNEGEATVEPDTMTFTAADWNNPQTVTVTGVDDAADDGDQTVRISHAAISADSAYNSLPAKEVTVTVVDDDSDEPSDTTPPDAPLFTSPTLTDSPTPTISGTAEPSSTLRLTITLGIESSVVYTTTVGADGIWSIDTANDTPSSGTFSGLEDGQYEITATATDAAGSTSAPATQTLTVDIPKPGDPATPLITSGDTTDSPTPTISGTAEAGVTITLTIDLGGGASVTYETTAGPNGTWSIDLATATPADGELPEGGLSDGSYPVTVTATNDAGSTSTQYTLTVQTSTPAAGTTLYLPLIAR